MELLLSWKPTVATSIFKFRTIGSAHLAYRGQLDDSRPGSNTPVTGRDLRAAIESVLADKPPDDNQRASIGCGIKWKSGTAPSYA
jgi:hypothetical protein